MERLVISCKECRGEFVVHRRCYRGHVYCGLGCQKAGRRVTARAARRRYRRSPEGRQDHCDAERARRVSRRVVDHSSRNWTSLAEMTAPNEKSDVTEEETGSVPRPLAARAWRSVHPLAHFRVGADGGTGATTRPSDAGDVVLERLAGRACIACGRRDGRLVRVVDRRARRHPS